MTKWSFNRGEVVTRAGFTVLCIAADVLEVDGGREEGERREGGREGGGGRGREGGREGGRGEGGRERGREGGGREEGRKGGGGEGGGGGGVRERLMDGYLYNHAHYPDINECETTNPCDSNAACTDTDGSFTCACNNGFMGDGLSCQSKHNNS